MDERQTLPYWKSQLDEIWLANATYVHKGKDIDQIIGYAFMDLLSQPERLKTADGNDFKRLVNNWLSNTRAMMEKRKAVPTRISLDGI